MDFRVGSLSEAEMSQLREKNAEATLQKLSELAEKYGYASVATLEALQLTPEQISRIHCSKQGDQTQLRFYTAITKDGQNAKVLACPSGSSRKMIAADFFSPAYPEGYVGDDNLSYPEMADYMKDALANIYHK